MSSSPVIIITGASRGIGKAATLEALKKFDARVIAIARSAALLEELHKHVSNDLHKGQQFEIVVGDVTDEKVIHKAVNIAIDKWGRLDSVIANAG
jgi:NADP-dependent 3-hydroxy acid dehydrogenase YdfG